MGAWRHREDTLRRAGLTIAAVVGISALLVRGSAPPAYAFECAFYPLEEHVATATIILTGTVTGAPIVPPVDRGSPDELDHRLYVDVAVDEYLKGDGPQEIRISTFIRYFFLNGRLATETSEDLLLEEASVGKRYVLFLSQSADPPSDPGSCGGSRLILEASGGEDYLQTIRDILYAVPAPSLPSSGGQPQTGWSPQIGDPLVFLALASGGTLIAAAAAFAYRRLAR